MGPTASKLARELRKVQRSKVVSLQAVREARAFAQQRDLPAELLEQLPPNHVAWMQVLKVLTGLAHLLLDMPALRKLAREVEEADEYYMPGSPPQSPVLDSVFVCWMMIDARIGPRRESLCDILWDLAPVLGLPEGLREAARTLGACRFGIYRMEELGPSHVRMTDISNGEAVEAAVPSGLASRAKLSLTRLLPPLLPNDADWVVWTTPAELVGRGAEAQWRDYFTRVAGDGGDQSTRIARHMARPPKSTYWLDYIVDGYAGMTQTGAIALLGVPDKPETLPHSPQFDPKAADAGEPEVTPLERVRRRLMAIAEEHDLADEDVSGIYSALGTAQDERYEEAQQRMLRAYAMFGAYDDRGRTAVDILAEDPNGLDADERKALAELQAGFMSAFEVTHVRIDEGMELRDVLKRRKLWLTERSATRQVQVGDLMIGWVLVDGERISLEGHCSHVPSPLASDVIDMMRRTRDLMTRRYPKHGWKRRAGLLAPWVTPIIQRAAQRAPLPQLHNHDGDPLLFSEARYSVQDPAGVRARLAPAFDHDDDDVFRMLSGGMLAATISLEGDTLRVETNSKQRLQRAKERVEALAGDLLKHQLDSHEDPMRPEQIAQQAGEKQPSASAMPLTPEIQEALGGVVLSQLRSWVDSPLPALGNRSPRAAVRSTRGREQVTHMLVTQERMLGENPQTAHVDLAPIWETLGLKRPRS